MTSSEHKELALQYVEKLEILHNKIFDYLEKSLNDFRAIGDSHLKAIHSWIQKELNRIKSNIGE